LFNIVISAPDPAVCHVYLIMYWPSRRSEWNSLYGEHLGRTIPLLYVKEVQRRIVVILVLSHIIKKNKT